MTVSLRKPSGMSAPASLAGEETGATMREEPVLGRGPVALLIVDDHRDICAMVQEVALEDGRFSVVGVTHDGSTALTLAERTQPDAVILDHLMKGRSGLDILPELRRLLPAATIVLWTSAGGDQSLALELGATEVREKPTPIHELLELIASRQHVR